VRLVAIAAPPWVTGPAGLRDAVPAYADLVELRLDLLPKGFDVAAAVAASPRPCLVTVRSSEEGGAFAGSPREAADVLLAALRAGVAWIDAEAAVLPLVAEAAARAGASVLLSTHGRGPVPAGAATLAKVARPGDDGPALAAALDEARALAASFRSGKGPAAFVVPYGRCGASARVVTAAAAEEAGIDALVFGVPGDAPGAPDGPLAHVPALAHLVDEGRLGEVTGRARLFGLVGKPPSRSPSPRIHAAAFRALGVDAVYLPECDVSAEEALALPYDGWSVTSPLKEEVARLCDRLDPLAKRAGAVNTVVRAPDGALVGVNTDALAVAALLSRASSAGHGALVVGGGGFARAAAVACTEAGLDVRLAGGPRAAAAAAELDVAHGGTEPRATLDDRVVVNATPAGAGGGVPPAWAAILAAVSRDALVVDAPYGEGGGPGGVATAARARGLRRVDGGELLVEQARHQARLFTGRAVTADALGHALRREPNLVLVGPRGAGKTTVGRLVAKALGKPFVDTDEEIARLHGAPAGRLLAERGEPAFRALESDAVARALARRGAVVALGGGALLDPASAGLVARRALRVNLLVEPAVAVARTAADASTPRPPLRPDLSPLAESVLVSNERALLYATGAVASVRTDGTSPEHVAERVLSILRAAETSDRRG
jgi:shikimate 5-dehydrogenase/shikimate kinase